MQKRDASHKRNDSGPRSPAVDRPRQRALEILRAVEDGTFIDRPIELVRQAFDNRDSAFIVELVYGTLRNRAYLDWVLNRFSRMPVDETDEWTRNILRLGAYQLLLLDRVPASAAVNTATELAKERGRKNGYVNGLLRALDRDRDKAKFPGAGDRSARFATLYSHPVWLVQRWIDRYGVEAAETLLMRNNQHAPLTIRTNTLRTTRPALKAMLASQGVESIETSYSETGLDLVSHPLLHTLSAYQDGLFLVQDQAAQLAAMMLAPRCGDAVLDACAAPGGKATHLAEMMENQGTIVALEQEQGRIPRIRENCTRLGITIVTPACGDAAGYRGGPFDRILIDAPCSGLGVLGRHPDGRWIKSEQMIAERAVLQQRILANCASLLRPGGALVYATCTTEPEENERVLEGFLAGPGRDFAIEDPRPLLPGPASKLIDAQGYFHSYPAAPEMDGFFAARLARKK